MFNKSTVSDSGTSALPDGPKLNLGCGLDYRDGYINIDSNHYHKVDKVGDFTWLQDIDDQSCSEIIAQDILEHVPRAKAETALREWNRVLKIGGQIKIRVPSLMDLANLLSRQINQTYEEQQKLIHSLYGTQGYVGDFHLNGFTKLTLKHDLERAGFVVKSMRIYDEWLLGVVACKVRHEPPIDLLRLRTDSEFLVTAYLDLFNREIDDGGKEYWSNVLKSGIARESVLICLSESDEYKDYHRICK